MRAPKLTLSPAERLARIADPTLILRDAGAPPPHAEQVKVLRDWRKDTMLLWSRQAGKSTTAAALALHNLLFSALDIPSTIVVISNAERQSAELFRKAREMYGKLPYSPPLIVDTVTVMETPQGGRIIAYPGKETTIRGLSAVTLALIDEAASIPIELRTAVTPMLATTGGPIWTLGTPKGSVGWFHEKWTDKKIDHLVRKSFLPWWEVEHLHRDFVEKEKSDMMEWQFKQEYCCEFVDDASTQIITSAVIEACIRHEVHAIW